MVVKKTLLMTALTLGLSAGVANAHEIPLPVAGDPYTLTEPVINWANGAGTSANNTLINNTVLAYHFDVTTAGSLDVYTNDHDDPNSKGYLYVYQKDAVGSDWTLTNYSFEGPRVDVFTPTNIFGVHITGYLDQINNGVSDAGVRANFDAGSYVAFVVGSSGVPFGYSGVNGESGIPTGAKLSNGFTWSYVTGDPTELWLGVSGLSDLTIKASPGSLAAAGATVEPPASVPVPGAIWLMGTVLAGFGAFGRKKTVVAA